MTSLVLETEALRVRILPTVGAKLYDLIRKASGRNFLWHNPRIRPHPFPVDANFDNEWCGGWDDAFPTADACEYKGEFYPSLGEMRSVEWTVERATATEAVLSAYGPITPVRVEKTVRLDPTAPRITLDYRLEHVGTVPFEFLWGTHPALAVSEHTRLHVPARTGIGAQSADPARFPGGEHPYPWPLLDAADGPFDMSRVHPPASCHFFGHYATDLDAGWFAVEHQDTGEGFLLKFPVDVCPHLWMWLVYGGWRGYHHAILEPWTGIPVNLAAAAARGLARRLAPGERFEIRIEAILYGGGLSLDQAKEQWLGT